MSKNNKFYTGILIFELFAICVLCFGEAKKELSQDKVEPKYEVKSDIINFDYTKLAYPTDAVTVGIKTNEKALKERRPPRELTDEEKLQMFFDDCASGFLLYLEILMMGFCCWSLIAFFPCTSLLGLVLFRDIKELIKMRKKDKKVD